jgi:hypothetical protein
VPFFILLGKNGVRRRQGTPRTGEEVVAFDLGHPPQV